MNRAALVRGIQLIVVITLATFAFLIYRGIASKQADLAAGFADLQPRLARRRRRRSRCRRASAAACASSCSAACSRSELRVRTAIISEFVLMFCAGVTPGQAGAAPSQVAVLVNGGMRFVDVATAELLTALCTIVFFLCSALLIYVLRATGALGVRERRRGRLPPRPQPWPSSAARFVALVLCAAYPPLLKGILRALAAPVRRPGPRRPPALSRASARSRAWAEAHARAAGRAEGPASSPASTSSTAGFASTCTRGKRAYAVAQLLTFGFFCSRFAVAYFILLGLGISTTPRTFVAVGPPIVQVVLVQALLNFALYLSPTPGASGIAEAGRTR